MELERMGFDLTVLAYVVLGNSVLVAIGAFLAAYFGRIIKRWEEEEAARACQNTTGSDEYDHSPVSMILVNHKGRQETNQPDRPTLLQPRVQASA